MNTWWWPLAKPVKNFNGMIRMNETGAFYWKELEQGTAEDDLVAKTMERFTDVTKETARQDVQGVSRSNLDRSRP